MIRKVILAIITGIFSMNTLSQTQGNQIETQELIEDFQASSKEEKKEFFRFSVGALAMYRTSIYKGGKNDPLVLPNLDLNVGPLFLRGPTIGSYIYGGKNWGLAAGINFIGSDDSRGDSKDLEDMSSLHKTYDVALSGFVNGDWGDIFASATYEISGRYDGYTVGANYGYSFQLSKQWRIRPFVNARYYSDSYTQYFYGVSEQDARIDRPQYDGKAAFSFGVGLEADYRIDNHNGLQFFLNSQTFSAGVTDSPIVDKSTIFSTGVGYRYSF